MLTHGLVRKSGFWIIEGKRLINSILQKYIKCKKLRGKGQIQKMADLPADRVSPAPPFSYVGLDVFGPWQVAPGVPEEVLFTANAGPYCSCLLYTSPSPRDA